VTPAPDDAAAPEQCAAQLRRDHPRWIVAWIARKGQFEARPLFRAPRDAVVTGATPEELTAGMNKVEQAAPARQKDTR
jgi:hypothetical protein